MDSHPNGGEQVVNSARIIKQHIAADSSDRLIFLRPHAPKYTPEITCKRGTLTYASLFPWFRLDSGLHDSMILRRRCMDAEKWINMGWGAFIRLAWDGFGWWDK